MEEFYLDGTLYYGRPQSAANRLDKEMACYDLLDRLEIPFARADHSPAGTIEMCEAVERVLGEKVCKNPVSYTHLDVYKRQVVHAQDNAAAVSAVSSVRAAGRDIFFPMKRHCAVSPVSGFDGNSNLIDK